MSTGHTKTHPSKWTPRAARFPIQTDVRYREQGQAEWSSGTTLNISRSGILFYAEHELKIRSKLELQLVFPSALTGGLAMSVVCWGMVVRKETSIQIHPRVCMATNIFHYRLTQDA